MPSQVSIYGTLIWYYFICKREVWLMSRQLSPFQDNEFLDIGRYLQEESFSRDKKSIRLENMEIDMIKRRDGRVVVGEVKKSSKFVESAKMQLAFYLYRLKEYGIEMIGELVFPTEKKRMQIILNNEMMEKINKAICDIKKIISAEKPPLPHRIHWCKNCAYRDFCFC